MAERYIFTSESVTEGHPDKVCDKISDSILDAILAKDPFGRVAVESLVTTGLVVVAGEVTTKTYVDIQKVVRKTIHEIGYHDSMYGFHADDVGVVVSIDEQSSDIAQGVSRGKKKLGAGDQGIMFGYACRETPELMPLPIMLAHRLAKRLTDVRKRGVLRYLRPDGKTEVAVEYVDGKPRRLDTVVIAAQHGPEVSEAKLRRDVIAKVVKPVCKRWLDGKTRYFVNETGKFVKGGPPADTGLTGRKIIVDTYGGSAPHGGGCFSGKDPTKVDRSATYAARWIAKNIVAAGLAEKCLIQLSYVIGVADPVSVLVNTSGTGVLSDDRISRIVRQHFDLTPAGFIRDLRLRRPIYAQTAAYGHFGRPGFPWEQTNKVRELRRYVR